MDIVKFEKKYVTSDELIENRKKYKEELWSEDLNEVALFAFNNSQKKFIHTKNIDDKELYGIRNDILSLYMTNDLDINNDNPYDVTFNVYKLELEDNRVKISVVDCSKECKKVQFQNLDISLWKRDVIEKRLIFGDNTEEEKDLLHCVLNKLDK